MLVPSLHNYAGTLSNVISLLKISSLSGWSKMPRCKAPEILRSEAYVRVRCNDEGREQRRRWAFFNSLLWVDPQPLNHPS